MAYKDFDGTEIHAGNSSNPNIIQAGDTAIDLPDSSYIRDANMTRDGMDLVLDGPHGTLTIEGYFSVETAPDLVAPEGDILTPELVESFAKSPATYASNSTMSDESPVGAVQEMSGEATVTRTDGSVEPLSLGSPIYQGDVIETGSDGAVNVVFTDETSFAVSEDARLAIDEFVFDPITNEGAQDFSVLKGVFVFTSGLIGREDPDDVNIDTPSGSIGIRGTIIAGDTNAGEITVVEGAIVVRDFAGNEMTLANQFETAKFAPGGGVENMGQLSPSDVANKFSGVSNVAPTLFSSINDAAAEQGQGPANNNPAPEGENPADNAENGPQDAPQGEGEAADGTVDADGDAAVDGSVEDGTVDTNTEGGEGESAAEGPSGEGPAPGEAPAQPAQGQNPGSNAPAPGTMMGPANGMGSPMGAGDMGGAAEMGSIDASGGMDMVDANGGMDMIDGTAAGEGPGEGPAGDSDGTGPNGPNGPGGAAAGNPDAPSDNTDPPPPPPSVLNDDDTNDGTTSANASEVIHLRTAVNNLDLPANEVNIAPVIFFQSGEGISWDYHFDLEFVDPNDPSSNDLDFELSAATITVLNDLRQDGYLDVTAGMGVDGSVATNDAGWSFDTDNGHLELFFKPGFTGLAIGNDFNFVIDISAIDSDGNTAPGSISGDGFFEYDFFISGAASAALPNINGNGNTYVGPNTNQTKLFGDTAVTTNNLVIAGNGDDVFTLGNNGFITNGNEIALGKGLNRVTLGNQAENNEIVGGFDEDHFIIAGEARNRLFGMDGDDKFELNLGDLSGLDTFGEAILWDAGHSSFSHLDAIEGNTVTDFGRGDSLRLEAAGTLDFRNVDNEYLRGFERIDMTDATSQTIFLTYEDIVDMTDYKNTLIFSGDTAASDTVNLVGAEFGVNFTKTHDNLGVDEDNGGAPDAYYDVWTDGNVTLLIEQNGTMGAAGDSAAVTGLT